MIKCPYCGTSNPDQAQNCPSCGTQLREPAQVADEQPADNSLDATNKSRMIRGGVWCIGGILITGLTYATAAPGGTYIIAWGAIIFGAMRFFQARSAIGKPTNTEDGLYAALELGTSLETRGRIKEAIALYERICQEHPNSPAARDARKSLESLRGQTQPA
jgi:hypothetical protein